MNYNFIDHKSDIQYLIHAINLHGKNLVGAEVGLFRAESFCTMLQNCPNITKLYGIDNWQPYTDFIGTMPMEVDEKMIELVEIQAMHNFKWTGETQRGEILKMTSMEASKKIDDTSLDFVFLDAYIDQQSTINDLNTWYTKVKPGGLFSGHDWDSPTVVDCVTQFRKDNNIQTNLSCYGDTWIWKKDE